MRASASLKPGFGAWSIGEQPSPAQLTPCNIILE